MNPVPFGNGAVVLDPLDMSEFHKLSAQGKEGYFAVAEDLRQDTGAGLAIIPLVARWPQRDSLFQAVMIFPWRKKLNIYLVNGYERAGDGYFVRIWWELKETEYWGDELPEEAEAHGKFQPAGGGQNIGWRKDLWGYATKALRATGDWKHEILGGWGSWVYQR